MVVVFRVSLGVWIAVFTSSSSENVTTPTFLVLGKLKISAVNLSKNNTISASKHSSPQSFGKHPYPFDNG